MTSGNIDPGHTVPPEPDPLGVMADTGPTGGA
jgi:hypothetical protein